MLSIRTQTNRLKQKIVWDKIFWHKEDCVDYLQGFCIEKLLNEYTYPNYAGGNCQGICPRFKKVKKSVEN